MEFTITLACDNAAFTEDPGVEVARILAGLAEQLPGNQFSNEYDCGGSLRDINGNTVGRWHVKR